MSTPFVIDSFEEYLSTVRNELPTGRIYFRGQSQLVSAKYSLKPSIGRCKNLQSKSLFEREEIERNVLGVFSNHVLSYVRHRYGVFDKQLFPDLDGIAKWLKYRVFEIDGEC